MANNVFIVVVQCYPIFVDYYQQLNGIMWKCFMLYNKFLFLIVQSTVCKTLNSTTLCHITHCNNYQYLPPYHYLSLFNYYLSINFCHTCVFCLTELLFLRIKKYSTTLWISLPDKPGKLGEISTLIGTHKLNISS